MVSPSSKGGDRPRTREGWNVIAGKHVFGGTAFLGGTVAYPGATGHKADMYYDESLGTFRTLPGCHGWTPPFPKNASHALGRLESGVPFMVLSQFRFGAMDRSKGQGWNWMERIKD